MSDNKRTENKKENFFLDVRRSWWVYLLFVVFAWAMSWIITDFFIHESTVRGTFGDKFGAVNALFSGLAFAGVIITILLQREELKATQDEVRAQTKEFELQNKTLALQRFEHSFFSMLSQHNEFISRFRVHYINGNTIIGKDIIKNFIDRTYARINSQKSSYFDGENFLKKDFSSNVLEIMRITDLKEYEGFILPYIKSICSLYFYIRKEFAYSVADDGDEKYRSALFYSNLVTIQLSESESLLLLLYAVSPAAADFRRLVCDFEILQGLPDNAPYLENGFFCDICNAYDLWW
ncbi:MAG: hypothetical protein PHX61_04405 [Alphaproteobacteria bacterium]|nr:hypothetical protein [Alphaproteobacteria bacterium]